MRERSGARCRHPAEGRGGRGRPRGRGRARLPGGQLDVLGVVVGAEVEDGVDELDPLHLQHFHICASRATQVRWADAKAPTRARGTRERGGAAGAGTPQARAADGMQGHAGSVSGAGEDAAEPAWGSRGRCPPHGPRGGEQRGQARGVRAVGTHGPQRARGSGQPP